jgi:hypothetical protein
LLPQTLHLTLSIIIWYTAARKLNNTCQNLTAPTHRRK